MKLAENTKLIWYAESGDKKRTSTIYSFLTKGYDASYAKVAGEIVLNENHLVQTTELNQPRLVGGIAPNSRLAASNQNGENRYFSHPEIAFAADEAWSFTVAINWNGSSNDRSGLFEKSVGGIYNYFDLRSSNLNNIYIVNGAGASSNNYTSSNPIIGKNTIITFVCDNSGLIKLYKNGVFVVERQHADSSIVFSDLFYTANATRFYNGKLQYYRIQDGTMTPEDIADEATMIRSWLPEVESVVIGSQEWTTSNLDVVATPEGNVIKEMQPATNEDKITQPLNLQAEFDTYGTGTTINDADSFTTTGNYGVMTKSLIHQVGEWIKVTAIGNTTSVNGLYHAEFGYPTSIVISNQSGAFSKSFYRKILYNSKTFICNNSAGVTDLSTLRVEKVGWSGLGELYTWLTTEGGYSEANALKEVAAWCYYNNDPANGAIYGKLYNWYAAKLLQNDIDAYNAANPGNEWGWRVPTEADFNTLVTELGGTAVAGGKMKMTGEDYWTTPNEGATNESGVTVLGAGQRSNIGMYNSHKLNALLWCINTNTRLVLDYSVVSITLQVSINKLYGQSIRLVKNS